MALSSTPSISGGVQSAFRQLDPAKYTALGDFINKVDRPDVREALVKTYGDQGITGFLQMTGAVKANGSASKVEWFEEARLHAKQVGEWDSATQFTVDLDGADNNAATIGDNVKMFVRVNDVILHGVDRYVVTNINEATGAVTVEVLGTVVAAAADGDALNAPIIGNLYAEGSDQPSRFLESNVVYRTNPYMILKETFKVTGSQATNIGYINLGGGDYRWYIKGEQDTRQRFLDKREMMMLLGVNDTATVGTSTVQGSEGYFAAIEDRGLVYSSTGGDNTALDTISELDAIIVELDKQGASPEYAIYGNTTQMLAIDGMVASLNGSAGFANGVTIGASAFGSFANADQAVKLGFKSFGRGGYTFHNKSWKLLNDPTLLGGSAYKGVMIPMTSVIDPKSGERAAALEMNYKAVNGYSREMEHWMTGSILGVSNTNEDSLQFNYRSECNLVTRAANQHVLIK
jgi:hypothetical protein